MAQAAQRHGETIDFSSALPRRTALAMSTDAFAAAVGKGTALRNPCISEALRTGIIFGVIEAITPLVGWALGSIAAEFVADWYH